MLENRIGNAVKYSPVGGVVTVRAMALHPYVEVSVSGQGIGSPSEALPKLFQRFYRADNVEQRHIGGIEVGLYVVRAIVALHDGTVTVLCAVGQGSTFTSAADARNRRWPG